MRGSREEYEGMIKLLSEEHIMYDIIEPSALGTDRTPRKLNEYEALILGDVSSMDDQLVKVTVLVPGGGEDLHHHHEQAQRLVLLDPLVAQVDDDGPPRPEQGAKVGLVVDVGSSEG